MIERAAKLAPETATVLYTGRNDRTLFLQAVQAGARGALHKGAPLDDVARAVHAVAGGATYLDTSAAAELAEPVAGAPILTRRELEVVRLVADGLTTERAAATLAISPETVQSHVRNAMRKLGAESRTEVVAKALRLSLIA